MVTLLYASEGTLSFSHYTNEDGLPSSYVKSISQDKLGFIWLATRSSVCRFDGKHFKTFKIKNKEGETIDLYGKEFVRYKDSLLVVQTSDNNFYVYNDDLEEFHPYQPINAIANLTAVYESNDGFWVLQTDTLSFLDVKTNNLTPWYEKLNCDFMPKNTRFARINENNKYIVAITYRNSLLVVDKEQHATREIPLPESAAGKSSSILFVDSYNHAWIGMYDYGICRISLTNGHSSYFSEKEKNNKHILHNIIHTIKEDKQGRIWIGTEDGLCIWSPFTETFDNYQYNIDNPDGLNTNPIYDIFCDNQGNVWMGTYFGGINLWCNTHEYFKVWKAGNSQQHISGKAVSCIAEDEQGDIWIGMEDMGINRIDHNTGMITYRINQDNGLSFNNVHNILFQGKDKMWISTYTGGINIYNLKTKTFEYINQTNYPQLPSNNIYSIVQVKDTMYIATSVGVVLFDLATKKIHPFPNNNFSNFQVEYMCKDSNGIWLSSLQGVFNWDIKKRELKKMAVFDHLHNVNFVKQDSKGRVWVGDCFKGLWGYDPTTDSVCFFNQSNGFPCSWIFSMEEDSDGNFWISSDKGLVHLFPETNKHIWYNRESGLPFEQFNFRASYKDTRGNIYFGANNGLISFNEKDNEHQEQELDIVFRGMQLFNQEVPPGSNSILPKTLNSHPEIHFKYKENVFTIEYSGLNFPNRGKCQYAYYLENFENDWNYVGTRDFATYTNISPGEYYFHVKASTDKNKWGNTYNTLKIVIEPPFWISAKGYLVYSILIAILLFSIFLVITRIQKSKALAEMERKEREYNAELNNFKLEFFTNISHELRTPLTLILGPLSSIMEKEELSPNLSKKMHGIKNNAQRLLNLINQLLEFRKIDRGKEKLKVSHQYISELINDIKDLFVESAISKGIDLSFETNNIENPIWVDCQKLENIIVNLLSNALKYTPQGGNVMLKASVIEKRNPHRKILEIKISDTGEGIDSEKINQIFDRFYTVDSRHGSGIGLAYVNSLVHLHKGKISVESNVGKGSVFTVELPVKRKDYNDEEIILGDAEYILDVLPQERTKMNPTLLNKELDRLKEKPTLLVVDDNEELLDFISEVLSDDYTIVRAINGKFGLEKVKECLPDLIISDVMMPEIDGYELTNQIKSDINTSHIPVVLLTAKSGEENEYEGLKTGADYYIEKPFMPHILKKLIQNILNTRKSLIERFKSDINAVPSEVACSQNDKDLIDKLTQLIMDNISKPDLDVNFLVKEASISRSLLHLKLKKLTACSATEFIRSIRLREAAKLIAKGKCNISEAAYQCGFSSPAYFSSRFKEYFGASPKEYFKK